MGSNSVVERVIHTSLRHKAVVLMLTALAVTFGILAYRQMPRNVYPDITVPVFTIVTENESMAPEEIELTITRPMESAMNGLPGVSRIRSQTTLGLSSVVVEFDLDTEFWRARQFVTERMSQVANALPAGTEPPMLSSATTRLAEVYELAIEGDLPLTELREIADWQVRYNLLNVPGVAEVLNMGGYLKQFKVTLDPNRLRAHGIGLTEVEDSIVRGNENTPGGFVSTGATEYMVRGIGRYDSLEDIRDTVVALRSDVPIHLSDIAEVEEGVAIRRGIATRNGREVVLALVIKQPEADTVTVVRGIEDAVARMREALPAGVRLVPYYNQTLLIDHSLSSVTRAIMVGAALVIVVLLAFLGHFRSTLIVAASLPISVLIAGILIRRLDIGLNTMTLGGIAIAVGMMVDASIIMVENIFHKLHRSPTGSSDHHTGEETVYGAATEVGRPIAFATLIIVAVFLPLFLMGGIEGLLFRPLAVTVAASMLAALVLSISLTPVLASRLLRPRTGERAREEAVLIEWIKRGYIPALDWAFRHAWLTRGMAIAITVPALIGFVYIGKSFMPRLDEGSWFVSTATPAETSLEENHRITQQVEQALLDDPDVAEVIKRNGRSERAIGCVLPVNVGEFFVNLRPRRQLTRPAEQVLADVRGKLESIPGIAVTFTQPLQAKIDESMEGAPAPLQVKLFGPDIYVLAEQGAKIEEIVHSTRGAVDVRMEQASGVPQLQVRVDRQAAARYGVSVGHISDVIRLAVGGEELTQVWKDQRSYGVFVRFPDSLRGDPDAISGLPVDAPSGGQVPLSQVADVSLVEGPNVIWREAMNRRISVDASIQGRDLAGVVGDIKEKLRSLDLPNGYYVIFGGHYENQKRAMRSLIVATLLALFVVFILLYVALGRASDALIIITTLPDAFVGGIIALLIAGETLNVSSGVGFIALFGISVQNGLVLLTQTRGFEAQGMRAEAAIRRASIDRLRPKLMTALCTALGVAPILASSGVGVEIEKPLAIVLVGGLITSTLFTLLVLPTVYVLVQRLRGRA